MRVKIVYSNNFVKLLDRMPSDLQSEVFSAVRKFENTDSHKSLKVHKLHGKFKDCYAFSVNYSHGIIFEHIDKKTIALLLTIGDHSIYEKFLK